MAARSIPTGRTALHGVTLTASSEDVVTFGGRIDGDVTLLVHPGTTTAVYVTADGTSPEPGEGRAHVVWPGYAARLTGPTGALSGLAGAGVGSPTQLRIWCAASAVYSVELD